MLVIVLLYRQKMPFKNDVVFEGKVIGVGRKEGVGIEVLFEVKEIWKGATSSQIIIYTNGGDCVFHFVEGGEYLVYSSQRGSEKRLHTNSCSRTKRLDEAGADKVALSQIAKESVPTKKVDLKGDGERFQLVADCYHFHWPFIDHCCCYFIMRKMRKNDD